MQRQVWLWLALLLMLAGPARAQDQPDNPVPSGSGRLISSVVVGTPSIWQAGSAVTVTLYGVPGGQASFDLGPIVGIPMQEVQPGTYRGQYVLTPNDTALDNPMVVGHLLLPNGQQANWNSNGDGLLTVQVNTGGLPTVGEGQTFQVLVRGTPGGLATFDVGSHYGRPLTEVNPGVYAGSYTVQPGDGHGPMQVQAHLTVNGATQAALAPIPVTFAASGRAGRPQIQNVTASATGAVMPNQTITLALTGTPYMQATYTINGVVYPMAEATPGSYVGSWTVPPGFPSARLPVLVTLTDAVGRSVSEPAPFNLTIVGRPVPETPVEAGDVTIDYPTMRNDVSAGFGVAGRTVPGALLRVLVYTTNQPVPGGVLMARQFDTQVQANADGSYNVPVILNGAMSGQYLDVRVQSVDGSGTVVGQDEVVVQLR